MAHESSLPASQSRSPSQSRSQSAGDALSIAFELVATPAVFAFFGWLIDRALGTGPLFTLLLCLLTAIYAGWKALHAYSERMAAYDRNLPSRRVPSNPEADSVN